MSAVPLGQLLPLFAAVPLLSAGLLVLAGERPLSLIHISEPTRPAA